MVQRTEGHGIHLDCYFISSAIFCSVLSHPLQWFPEKQVEFLCRNTSLKNWWSARRYSVGHFLFFILVFDKKRGRAAHRYSLTVLLESSTGRHLRVHRFGFAKMVTWAHTHIDRPTKIDFECLIWIEDVFQNCFQEVHRHCEQIFSHSVSKNKVLQMQLSDDSFGFYIWEVCEECEYAEVVRYNSIHD